MQNVKQKEHFLCFSAERGRGQKQAYEGKKISALITEKNFSSYDTRKIISARLNETTAHIVIYRSKNRQCTC